MSMSIHWRPAKEIKARLDVPAPSSFIDVMEQAGFHFPCVVSAHALPILRGMAIVFGRNGLSQPNPYGELADLLEKHGDLEIWAQS